MEISSLVTPDGVVPRLRSASKKQVLQELARHASRIIGADERVIFDALLERERLGSTGVGLGIAIPHAKLPGLPGLYGVFARATSPIDFDSVDEQPVDLVFLLLAPEDAGADHLKALARVSRLLRNQDVCQKLRGADSQEAIYALLTEEETGHPA
ncbi:MAG: PTS IIA-like nitrogen regulatory protein PtsN [bacterium]|nr:PTS IIA-like nitrogen regulatory protein PtsN [bacterium]MDE0418299.1 PTS IIA-like nitrogen regulatory protein PtsN [bacterium]